jgi:hypothetical protein
MLIRPIQQERTGLSLAALRQEDLVGNGHCREYLDPEPLPQSWD